MCYEPVSGTLGFPERSGGSAGLTLQGEGLSGQLGPGVPSEAQGPFQGHGFNPCTSSFFPAPVARQGVKRAGARGNSRRCNLCSLRSSSVLGAPGWFQQQTSLGPETKLTTPVPSPLSLAAACPSAFLDGFDLLAFFQGPWSFMSLLLVFRIWAAFSSPFLGMW